MAIPDYQSIMLPLLKLARDEREHVKSEVIESLAAHFNLTDAERRELLPSGQQEVFSNRVGWAGTYLKKAGLLSSPRRGHLQITQRGLDVLSTAPKAINVEFLTQFQEFKEFRALRRSPAERQSEQTEETDTPVETLERIHTKIRRQLADELLQKIASMSPSFFERLVIDLLLAMGYGGSRADAGQALGRSGDGGIDGIINEDRLGLDSVYIQAKRWDGVVGRPEVQKFAGALQGVRAKKGIFITTSSFSREAQEFVANLESRIVLISGSQLTELMIEHGVGVTAVNQYEIHRMDLDYFGEDE